VVNAKSPFPTDNEFRLSISDISILCRVTSENRSIGEFFLQPGVKIRSSDANIENDNNLIGLILRSEFIIWL